MEASAEICRLSAKASTPILRGLSTNLLRQTASYLVLCCTQVLLLALLLVWMLHGPQQHGGARTSQAAPPSAPDQLSPSLIQNLVDAVSEETLTQHIRYLQDDPDAPGFDSWGTRYSYSPGLAHAAEYIFHQFDQLGLTVEYDDFLHQGTVMTNVVATLPGIGPESDSIYILGAHFDSTAERTPNWDSEADPAPGADDNASGTAVVLELARVLSQERFAHTLRFVTFGGEEQGLRGSAHYAWEAWMTGQDVRGMINLDMVGWDGDGDRVMEIHAGTRVPASMGLAESWRTALAEYDLNLVPQTLTTTATSRSDHASFWSRGYPAILLIEDAMAPGGDFNPYYHSTADTLDKLDMSYAVDFARATVATLADLAVPIAPDLGVSVIGPPAVVSGGLLTYTLAYSNAGAETATGAQLIETLPHGLIYLSDDGGLPKLHLSPDEIMWEIGALPPGEEGQFNLVLAFNVSVEPGTLLTNTVKIGSVAPEAELDNNATTITTTVITGPPAKVAVVVYPTAIPADGQATAVITATIADGTGYPVEDGTSVIFSTSLGTVEPIETVTQGGVATTTLRSEQRAETAVITAVAGEVWEETSVAFQPADVTLVKAAEPTVVTPGDLITYTLVFRNFGPATATAVSIVDPLLPELYTLGYSFAGPVIIPGDLPQEWRVADLAPGEGGTITVTARVRVEAFWSDRAALINEATIYSATVDLNPENNVSAATTALVRRIYLPLASMGQ